jgi:hypothetical protein
MMISRPDLASGAAFWRPLPLWTLRRTVRELLDSA